MNIILSTDDNYVQHCCVTMTSILENNTDVSFYLFTEGLSESNANLLDKQVRKYGGKLNVCVVDNHTVGTFPMPDGAGDHISLATYYRLFAAILLPKDVTKAIYMDCDIVIRGCLDELWSEDLDGYALGAVYQKGNNAQVEDKKRLMIPDENGYFNAGVLLINLAYWRETKVTERLFEFIKSNFSRIRQHDQDTLNAVLYAEVKPISYVWNYLPLFKPSKDLIFPPNVDYSVWREPVVIHFVSIPKPWEVGSYNPYTYEYYKYLDKTPFAGWRPKFKWKLWWPHVGKVKLVRLVNRIDILKLRKIIRREDA